MTTEPQAWVDALCAVLGWDYRLRSNAGRAAKLGKELRDVGGTVTDVSSYFGQTDYGAAWWWYRDTWQGRKGQRPTPGQIAENWGAWTLPIAVQPNSMGGVLNFIEDLRHGDAARND
jgi:hypothetical protein